MTLGQKLRQTRLSKGLSQSQVAGGCVTRNMLSQIENDRILHGLHRKCGKVCSRFALYVRSLRHPPEKI